MFPHLYIPTSSISPHLYFPTALYPHTSITPELSIPVAMHSLSICSLSSISPSSQVVFHQQKKSSHSYVPGDLCSHSSSLCFRTSISLHLYIPNLYIPKALYPHSSISPQLNNPIALSHHISFTTAQRSSFPKSVSTRELSVSYLQDLFHWHFSRYSFPKSVSTRNCL